MCVLAGAGVRAAQLVVDAEEAGLPRPKNAVGFITEVLLSWDGRWYLEIVRHGYPHSIPPNITYEQSEARAAFFPVYPMIVRFVDAIAPGGDTHRRAVRQLRPRPRRHAADRPLGAAPHRRRRGRGAGDGDLRRLPGIVRAVVRLRRGGVDRAVRSMSAPAARRALGAGGPRRCTRNRDAAKRGRHRRRMRRRVVHRHPRATRLGVARRTAAQSDRLRRVPDLPPAPHRRVVAVVPGPARGMARGHQLRGDRDPQHDQLPRPIRSPARPTYSRWRR